MWYSFYHRVHKGRYYVSRTSSSSHQDGPISRNNAHRLPTNPTKHKADRPQRILASATIHRRYQSWNTDRNRQVSHLIVIRRSLTTDSEIDILRIPKNIGVVIDGSITLKMISIHPKFHQNGMVGYILSELIHLKVILVSPIQSMSKHGMRI